MKEKLHNFRTYSPRTFDPDKFGKEGVRRIYWKITTIF